MTSKKPSMESSLQAFVELAVRGLTAPRHEIAEVRQSMPDKAGLYAIYGDRVTWEDLGLGEPPDERPLYVGKAERSLASRDVKTHFQCGRTGQSTLRRSIAALLRTKFALRGIPRNPLRPERATHYSLSAEHDAMLDTWMAARLRLAFWTRPHECKDLGAIEVVLLRLWHPPLNLQNNKSPWRTSVVVARETMASDVRAWCLERGWSLNPR